MLHRPRRNRKSEIIRALAQETHLRPSQLIYPLFVLEGKNLAVPIPNMPGIFRLSLDLLIHEVAKAIELGIGAFALFPVIPREKKDEVGSEAFNPKGILPLAIRAIKQAFPEACVISDVALDPYTSHGHDGPLDERGDVPNDRTVALLEKMALLQAEAGTDMVAPSDMMDGRVRKIREALDANHFSHVSIHAYAAKFASSFYGPFREALGSGLKKGNKKSYQLNPANAREAILEAILDEEEGADILMIKPALPYLDVIAKIRENTHLPLSAFQVSGEFAMIKFLAQNGGGDEDLLFLETLTSIKRAGADIILTYAAPQVAKLLLQ